MTTMCSTYRHPPSYRPLARVIAPAALFIPLLLCESGCSGPSILDPVEGSDYTGTVVVSGAGIGATGQGTGGAWTGSAGKTVDNTGTGGKGTATAGNGTGGRGTSGTATVTAGSGTAGRGAGGRRGRGTGGTTGVGGNTTTGAGGATAGAGGGTVDPGDCELFSFFVTSLVAMQRESGSKDGFGGNLGGLAGADEICRSIAEYSLPCAGNKVWRAFLSTSQENAIDRVGPGPWYDRRGRVVALTTADLAKERPANADSAIANDLPNEDGVPNHNPGSGQVDNHDTLTGSDSQGKLAGADFTCSDWTSTSGGKPRIGHSWPGGPSKNWINGHTAPGCGAGVNLSSAMGESGSCVGCSGGYGGIYCLATTP